MAGEMFELIDEVDEAEIFLDKSLRALHDFDDRWFSDLFPKTETIRDIEYRYGLLQAHLWLIITALDGAEERLQNIINRYTGGKKHDNGNVVGQ